MYWGGAVLIPRLYHASLRAVFYVNPVLHAGCGALVQCLMCFHGLVQYCCFAIVITSSLPVTGVGRLWATVLVRCVLCVHRGAMPDGMWIVSGRGWCKLTFQGTLLKVSGLCAIW